ncbi:MAG: pyridoxal-phosphate dependent enzyme [Planctomycetota bacterium]|jgi:cystathionine beta-synthase
MARSADPSTRPVAPTFNSVLEQIGNTPMLELKRMESGPCRLLVKLESANPGNSIKDRIAVSMIEQAERDGSLRPGGHIIEATAGNTGIALALVASQKDYDVTVVVPDKMSEEKISHLRAMGAEVVLTRSDVEKGHPEYYQDIAERLAARTPDGFYVNQFGNDANVRAHYETTGPEIWQQTDGRIDAFVAGVGTGGTITGVGRYLKEQKPEVEIVLADPEGSVLAPLVNEGRRVKPGAWIVEGIGEDFVPPILDLDVIDSAYAISDRSSLATGRQLLSIEGILGGSSTGTLLSAALRYCREQTEPKTVVSLICDNGSKYLSKMFNDYWMLDQGFLDRKMFGDIRDLIARRHLEREDYTLKPTTPLSQAVKTMRMYDISQMVVLDESDCVVGIIDESDILLAFSRDRDAERHPVNDYMTRKLQTIPTSASVSDLLPIFQADRVAIVADGEHFYGLITKIDLINYLRRQLAN